jgi:hypothetical protein
MATAWRLAETSVKAVRDPSPSMDVVVMVVATDTLSDAKR